jgi:hypothetical protein
MTQPTRTTRRVPSAMRAPHDWERWQLDRPTMTAPTCNSLKDRHIYWVHGGDGCDRCLCGRSERVCGGVDECELPDFSWLPHRGSVDD